MKTLTAKRPVVKHDYNFIIVLLLEEVVSFRTPHPSAFPGVDVDPSDGVDGAPRRDPVRQRGGRERAQKEDR